MSQRTGLEYPLTLATASSAGGTPIAKRVTVEDPSASKTTETAARSKRGGAAAAPTEFPWARMGNVLLGLWLQISAFAWPHGDSSRISSWVMGLLISIVAVLSMGAPPMRWLNGVLGLWLIAWTVVSASGDALSYWNGVVAGLLVVVLSTIGTQSLATDYKE